MAIFSNFGGKSMGFIKENKYRILALSALLICVGCYSVFGFNADKVNTEFLQSYGWETTGHYTDKSDIIIPSPFDMVYKNYNLLQLDSGLDLEPYMGKSGTRYTYIVTNYPLNCEETVYANVIVIENKCVAGDIMTVPIDGFIHPLSFRP